MSAGQITFATITAGPIIALILYFIVWKLQGSPFVAHTTLISLVGNSISFVPIVCLLLNVVGYAFAMSFTPGAENRPSVLDISGNEATIFIALLYAAMTLANAIYKGILEARAPTA